MLASRSSPTMTLHHRGCNDIGTINGLSADENHYVPRAGWTEANESPMKLGNRRTDWDPMQFLKEEHSRSMAKKKQKEYLLGEYGKQFGKTATLAASMRSEKEDETAKMKADVQANLEHMNSKGPQLRKNQELLRTALDVQTGNLEHRHRSAAALEAREAAELKLRNAQLLCAEMKEQESRRLDRVKNAEVVKRQMATNEGARRDASSGHAEEFKQTMRAGRLQDEAKQAAKQARLEDAQRRISANEDMFLRTAAKDDREKLEREERRQEAWEKAHNLRTDVFYAKREQARERQRQQMVLELDAQVKSREVARNSGKHDKTSENDAIMAAARRNMDNELQIASDKRSQEKQVQQELLSMMEAKRQTEREEGYRRPAVIRTMASPEIAARQEADSFGLQRLPFRALEKRADGTSHSAVSKAPSAKAFARSAELIARDLRLEARWSDGVTREEMRAGRAAARRRQADQALGKAEVA
eukprot:TRINITY_DN22290_c0_g1_i1.p1 TRINITY_DN22290_c0_g1~~TRINITY_DN22290_c0_g1_i1.p1  ORF type:complete len:474 (+),score=102.42 TRINITY_DN22290_c0_g1_i1:115-1536(+)